MRKLILLICSIFIFSTLTGCSDSKNTVSTPLGEGEYHTFLNANGEPLKDDKPFLFIESSEDLMTEENIIKFYNEVLDNSDNNKFSYGIAKVGEYGLRFSPKNNIISVGKIKYDCGPLLKNSNLEKTEKFLVIENNKITVEN